MSNKIKTAFDDVHAGDKLKVDTMAFLRVKMRENKRARSVFPVKKIAAAFASLLIIVLGAFSYNLYFTENAYVDLDVNPSIEFTVNRFDRVINAYAYNADGAAVLGEIDVTHKNYRDAIETALSVMAQKGFMTDTALISVTLQTGDAIRDAQMLSGLETTLRSHHGNAQINVFSVDGETRNIAHDLNLTPAKYLAILELQEVDPTASVESCRNHTIGEIYQMTQEHSRGHHGGAESGVTDSTGNGSGNGGSGNNGGYGSGGHDSYEGEGHNGYENENHNGGGQGGYDGSQGGSGMGGGHQGGGMNGSHGGSGHGSGGGHR